MIPGVYGAKVVPFDEGGGAGDRNRTRDLLFTRQLLYQLSYTGTLPLAGGNCPILPVAKAHSRHDRPPAHLRRLKRR